VKGKKFFKKIQAPATTTPLLSAAGKLLDTRCVARVTKGEILV
jgi:hypothetical protein